MPKPMLLLVDDSEEMGVIVAALGRRAGCEVAVCPDAEDAWRALSGRRPDLVLLDVNLPGASGLDWLRRVRADPAFAGLPVALYTHWGLPGDVAAGLEAGVDFVFDKEFAARPADWQRRLAELLAAPPDAWPNAPPLATITNEGNDARLTAERVGAINQVLRHSSVRRLAPEVIRAVLGRALTRTFAPRILPSMLKGWIAPDGSGLLTDRLPPGLAPDSAAPFAARLTEQIERLLGPEAGGAFRGALAAALPGVSGLA